MELMPEYMVEGQRAGRDFQAPTMAETPDEAKLSFLQAVIDSDVEQEDGESHEEFLRRLERETEFTVESARLRWK